MRDNGSTTARSTTFCRALTGVDPLATDFLGQRGRSLLRVWRRLARWGLDLDRVLLRFAQAIAARTVHFDQRIVEAVEAGIDQVVILGAGFDTRGWRLPALGDATLYLVDHPHTARARQARSTHLPPAGRRVDVDFAVDDVIGRLVEAGFDPQRPSMVVWEGVAMYLDEAVVRDNLMRLRRAAAPGSRLVFDGWHSRSTGWGRAVEWVTARVMDWLGEPIVYAAPPEALAELCRDVGWTVRDWCRSHGVPGFDGVHGAGLLFELIAE